MAKFSRSSLKVLIKECLVEILAEGLAANPTSLKNSTRSRKASKTRLQESIDPVSNRPALDYLKVNQEQKEIPSTTKEFIKSSDPVMEAIFNDTLQNTLNSQASSEGKDQFASRLSHGDAATKAMATSDPTDLFEGASNWAALAFSEK
jgi:hypothetical protein